YHEAKGTLDRTPLHFEQEQATAAVTPLRYPGKVLPDPAGNRLFIADSTHHRIVVADLKTFEVKRVIGSGRPGLKDGGPIEARFSEPQGMALDGETLYVADTKNHALRAVDLKTGKTTLVAGDGRRGFERTFKGPGKTVSLASPWDVLRIGRTLYIAMAGTHQIWTMNLDDGELANMAGSGREDIIDGTYDSAAFAQPSGLATDGEWLYVADSEVSGVRKVSLTKPVVETVVGEGLFDFGDKDGVAGAVRLQHALGVAYADGVLYVADTYNNKLKKIDPKTRAAKSFLGDKKAGKTDEPARFDEPGGLAIADGKIYVADTNNHLIRIVDLKTGATSTATFAGLTPPEPADDDAPPAGAVELTAPAVQLKPGAAFTVAAAVPVPAGSKLNPAAPMTWRVEALAADGKAAGAVKGKVKPAAAAFTLAVAGVDLSGAAALRVTVTSYPCETGSEGVCRVQTHRWIVPITLDAAGVDAIELPPAK
ncbi:MAG: NHL repeat-containing protein, partial [Planctomycetia bacterium]